MSFPIRSRSATKAKARAFLAFATLLALACAATFPSAPALAKRAKQRHAAPLYWGAQIGDQLTGEQPPWDMNAVFKFERLTRKRMSLISFSAPFADCSDSPCVPYSFPTTPMQNVRNHGAIPFFSWNSTASPEEANQRPFRLARLIAGGHDPYIREFAEAARDWGHPFFLRFNWEMNGFWFPWSEGVNGNRRGQFVAAWRHVHDVFASVGATNVTWVWCPNVDFTRQLIPLRTVYPGHAYVDWTCLDGFNWGKRHDSAGWQTFNEVFGETYRRVLKIAPRKPMVIGEVASNEVGGSKPAWIRNMLRVVPSRYRKVRGLIWFDVVDRNTNWPLETSRKSSRAFANGVSRSVYRPNVFGRIATSPIPPPPGD